MTTKKKKQKENSESKVGERLIAKRDFVICQNEFYLEIKKGDEIKDLPERFLVNLRTEKVI